MKNTRYYLSLLGESYEARGVRLGDSLTIDPGRGRKKVILLKRTCYIIQSYKGERVEQVGNSILIPSLTGESFQFELKICDSHERKSSDNRLRFLLSSISNTPYRHNNSLVYESFIERGDTLNLGYNRFHFNFKISEISLENRELLSPSVLHSNLNILIEGETGTGKTHLAKEIHSASERIGKFVHLNVSSFSSSLVESELFGHTKGAFTGAVNAKVGALREANLGTLFIDEVDSLSWDMQTKLLLFLDEGKVRPVGDSMEYTTDVRLIFASGANLKKNILLEKMRRDFFFRISNGVTINLAPLRKDPHRIKKVIYDFMIQEQVYIDKKLIEYYLKYSWPGNIRQLLGHLKKKKVFSKSGKFSFDSFDKALEDDIEVLDQSLSKIVSMKDLKSRYALQILNKYKGNISEASRAIGVTPKTMRTLTVNQL